MWRFFYRMHPIHLICLFSLGMWLLVGLGSVCTAEASHIQPGEKRQLTAPDNQVLWLEVKQPGMYRIETEGESDTHCTLVDRQQGQIAADDNSGVAKNCRIDIRLIAGVYQLQIRKEQRPIQVAFHTIPLHGDIDTLLPGNPHLDELTAGQIRSFRFHLKQRRWLDLQAVGVTVQHCHLLDKHGWSVAMQQEKSSHHPTTQGYMRSCRLQGLLEPGEYHLHVQGERSQAAPQGRSVTQGSMLIVFGEQAVQPFVWHRVVLNRASSRTYQFQIPQAWGHRTTGQVKVLVQVKHTGTAPINWSVAWFQQNWLSPTPQSISTCTKQANQPENQDCSLVSTIDTEKRYLLRVSGPLNQRFRMRYVVLFPAQDLSINQRVRVLDQPGQTTHVHFSVANAGAYWLESWPLTRSCVLEQEIRPHVWNTVHVQSMALHNEITGGLKKPHDDHRSTTWTSWLATEGTTQWIQLRTESTLTLGTQGETDTHCALFDANGRRLAINDDKSKEDRNCQLEQRLQPGLYRWTIRAYQRPGMTTISVQVRGDSRSTAIPRAGSCSFAQTLAPGQYRLRLSAAGHLHLREVGVFSLPLQERQMLRIPQALHTLASGALSSYRIPLRLQNRFQWMRISGVFSCALIRAGQVFKQGWMRKNACQLRGRFPVGEYVLEFSQKQGTLDPITVRTGGSVRGRIAGYRMPSLDSAPERVLEDLVASSKNPNHWNTHFNLKPQQTRTLSWQVPQTGLYKIRSHGMLQAQCHVFNARDNIASSAIPTLSARNCEWIGRLEAGSYRLHVQAHSTSQGRISVEAEFVPTRTLPAFSSNQQQTNLLVPAQGHLHPIQIIEHGRYMVATQSIDGDVACRFEDSQGWPIWIGTSCQFWQELKPGNYRLYLNPGTKSLRYRVSAHTHPAWLRQWPPSASLLERNIQSKPMILGLNQVWTLRYQNAQPSDTLYFSIPTQMTVDMELSSSLMGQLFSEQQLVAQWAGTPQSPHKQTLALAAGLYRIVLQGKYESLQTHRHYSVKTSVLETRAGARLWQPVSSSLWLNLPQAGGVSIATTGQQDVWCQIFTKEGKLVAFNDDANSTQWDCKLTQWLSAGTYRIHLDGVEGHTWLNIQPMQLTEQPLTFAATPARVVLQPHQRHAFTFQIQKSGTIGVSASITAGKLHCMLEDLQHQQPVGRVSGTSCDRMYSLREGRYKLHVYHTETTEHTVQAQAQLIQGTKVKLGDTATLQLSANRPAYVEATVQSPMVQIRWTSPVVPSSLQCSVTTTTGEQQVSCEQPHLVGIGHQVWKIRSRVEQQVQFQWAETTYTPGHINMLQLTRGQSLTLPVTIPTSGLYRLQGQTNTPHLWYVRWDDGQKQTISSATTGISIYAYLSQGDHKLYFYQNQTPEAKQHPYQTASVLFQVSSVIAAPVGSVVGNLGTTHGKLEAKRSLVWKLAAASAYHINLTLHGDGDAFVVTKTGHVVQHCRVSKQSWQTCRWYVSDQEQGSQLWLLAQRAGLSYRWTLQQAPFASPQITLTLGSQWKSPSFVKHGSTWRVSLKGTGTATVEVIGRQVQCFLQSSVGSSTRCVQHVDLSVPGQTLVVRATKGIDRILLYGPQQRMQAVWGTADWTPSTPTTEISPDRWVVLSNGSNEVAWYRFRLPEPRVVSVYALGQAMRCALGTTQAGMVWATYHRKGCRGHIPLPAGDTWLGIRSDSKQALQGPLMLSWHKAEALQEGKVRSTLLGAGESLWYRLALDKKTYVGLGAIGRHDDLICQIYNEQGKVVAQGCQNYLDLHSGNYWYQVSVPHSAEATWVKAILRGKNPPPNQPPTAYLKRFLEQTEGEQ